jgi:hypothetical protein
MKGVNAAGVDYPEILEPQPPGTFRACTGIALPFTEGAFADTFQKVLSAAHRLVTTDLVHISAPYLCDASIYTPTALRPFTVYINVIYEFCMFFSLACQTT